MLNYFNTNTALKQTELSFVKRTHSHSHDSARIDMKLIWLNHRQYQSVIDLLES
jgi:hypothetical protein